MPTGCKIMAGIRKPLTMWTGLKCNKLWGVDADGVCLRTYSDLENCMPCLWGHSAFSLQNLTEMELFISGGAREDLDLESGLKFLTQIYLEMSEHKRFTGIGCIHHCNICVLQT